MLYKKSSFNIERALMSFLHLHFLLYISVNAVKMKHEYVNIKIHQKNQLQI
jgi:hypothetical protein